MKGRNDVVITSLGVLTASYLLGFQAMRIVGLLARVRDAAVNHCLKWFRYGHGPAFPLALFGTMLLNVDVSA